MSVIFSGGLSLPPQHGNGSDGSIIVTGLSVSIKDIYEKDDVTGVITKRGVNKGLNYGIGAYQPFLNQAQNKAKGVPNFVNVTIQESASLISSPRSSSSSDGILWIACIGVLDNKNIISATGMAGFIGQPGSKRYGGAGGHGGPGAGGGGCGRGQYTSGPPGTGGQAYLLLGGSGDYWNGGAGTLGGTSNSGRGGLGGGGYGQPGPAGIGYDNNPPSFSDWRLLFGSSGGGGGGGDARAKGSDGEISGGGGAGGGGAGGGFIYISCASYKNSGTILSNGGSGGTGGAGVWNGFNGSGAGGGGGAGGIIYIEAKSFSGGLGTVYVNGGLGGQPGSPCGNYGCGEPGVSGGEGIVFIS
jgi:hypothetical protein